MCVCACVCKSEQARARVLLKNNYFYILEMDVARHQMINTPSAINITPKNVQKVDEK